MIRILIALFGLSFALAASAAVAPPPIAATCATFDAALAAVLPGGSIVLTSTTPCPPIAIANRSFSPAVLIDATRARLTNVSLNGVVGLTWRGGDFDGGNTRSTGWSAGTSSFVAIEYAFIHNYLRNSIILGASSDFRVVGNTLSRSGADGIDIAMSRRGLIDGNQCSDPDTTTGSHPDCIQLWSRPEAAPVADIIISRNMAFGRMQGFTGFNHVRGGVNDGGFDRITVTDNVAAVSQPGGIYFTDCRKCVFRGNHIYTPHGAAHWTNFVVNGVSSGSLAAADQTFQDNR